MEQVLDKVTEVSTISMFKRHLDITCAGKGLEGDG